MPKQDGVEVEAILVDKAEVGQALRQVSPANLKLPIRQGGVLGIYDRREYLGYRRAALLKWNST